MRLFILPSLLVMMVLTGCPFDSDDDSAPRAPVVLGNMGAGVVTLSWAKVLGATSYNIYSSADGNTYAYLDITSENFFDVAMADMYYKVTAVNEHGESVYSNAVNATPLTGYNPVGILNAKVDGAALATTPTGVSLTPSFEWDSLVLSGAILYTVVVLDASTSEMLMSWQVNEDGVSASHTLTYPPAFAPLPSGTMCVVIITAYNLGYWGFASNMVMPGPAPAMFMTLP